MRMFGLYLPIFTIEMDYIGKCSCHMDGMGISESSRLPVWWWNFQFDGETVGMAA